MTADCGNKCLDMNCAFPALMESGNVNAMNNRMGHTAAHVSEQSQMAHSALMSALSTANVVALQSPNQMTALALDTAKRATSAQQGNNPAT